MINFNNEIKKCASGVALMLAMLAGGCASSGVVSEADPSAKNTELVEVQNKALAKKVSIRNFKTREINDLLNVQLEIQSEFSSTQEFQYKLSWFDGAGFEVESEANSWKTLLLYGKETKTVQAVAPNPTVKKFKLFLREL
mgnify:CR=1 FL=1